MIEWIKWKLSKVLPVFELKQRGFSSGDPFLLKTLSDDFAVFLHFKEGIIFRSIHVSAQEILESNTLDDHEHSLETYYEKALNEMVASGLIKIKLTRKGRKAIKEDLV